MPDSTSPDVPPRLVSKVDGVIDKQKFSGTIDIPADPPSGDLGEWEYVLVARVPSLDMSKSGAKPLAVSLAGEMARIEIMIDSDAPTAHDALVTLTGSDGYQRSLGVVSQGKKHPHTKGVTALYFDGLKIGVSYTATVDPGNNGTPYNVFQNVVLTQDHVLKPDEAAAARLST